MKIAITLVHNKSDDLNEAQITTLRNLLSVITETVSWEVQDTDKEGNPVDTFHTESADISHYEFTDFPGSQVLVYQVIPFGVNPPPNLYDIDSYKVFYGQGDSDKVGNHPRFFNWGLKRGTDHGADLSIYIEDVEKFNIKTLSNEIQEIASSDNPKEATKGTYGKIMSVTALKENGQLDETKSIDLAFQKIDSSTLSIPSKEVKNG